CVEAATGKLVWVFETGAEIDAGANFIGDKVLIGSQDATLYCLDAATGELAWKHPIDDQIRCSPTIAGDYIFVAGCDSRLHILDIHSGEEKKSVEIESPTGVTPAARGDHVFFGTEAGVFFCVDYQQAKEVWRFQDASRSQPIRSSPAVQDGLVVFGGRNKRVHALDAATGAERWTYQAKNRVDSSPVIVGDRVFFGAADGRLTALNLK